VCRGFAHRNRSQERESNLEGSAGIAIRRRTRERDEDDLGEGVVTREVALGAISMDARLGTELDHSGRE
jgi:hypothetical protein